MSLAKQTRFVILVAGGVCGGLILYALLSSVLVSWKVHQQEVREAEIQRQLEVARIAKYEQDAIDAKREEEETKNAELAEQIWREIIEQAENDSTEQSLEEKITKQPNYQKRLAEVGPEKCRSEELTALERVVKGMNYTRQKAASMGLYSVETNEDKLWLTRVEGRILQLKRTTR